MLLLVCPLVGYTFAESVSLTVPAGAGPENGPISAGVLDQKPLLSVPAGVV